MTGRKARKTQPELAPLLAIGATSLIWQVASARALLAGLYGNELVLGMVLGTWLLLVGVTTALSARLAAGRGSPLALLAGVLFLLPVAILGSLLLQHWTLPAYGAMDQIAGPGRAALAGLVCLLPACLFLGAAFGLVSLLVPEGYSSSRWAARIYVVESLGTALAGMAFHGWLARWGAPSVGVAAGLLAWSAGITLLWRVAPRQRRWVASCALVGAAGMLVAGVGIASPGRSWLERRVPGYEVLARENSPHAELAVLRRADQVLFLASGVVVFTNQDDQRAQTDVRLGLLAHPAPRRVLMLGGGLGAGLREALRHPVERVDYVELDQQMIALARRFGGERIVGAFRDRRVRLLIGDGRQVVARSSRAYDVILVDMPGPSSALINRFYTREFFASAREALRAGGLLRTVLPGSETYLSEDTAAVHATVRGLLRSVFGNAAVLPGQSTLLFAGRDRAADLGPTVLARRLQGRGLAAGLLGEVELMDRALPLRRELYEQRLTKASELVNSDLHPAVYFHAALSWFAVSSETAAQLLGRLGGGIARVRWLLLAGALGLAFALTWLRRRGGAPGLAIFAAGLTGLACEVCLLLAAQEIRGVVYHEMGALLTAFMLGLPAGAAAGNRLVERGPQRALMITLGGCGVAALACAGAVHLAVTLPELGLALFSAALLLLGAAVGSCYPAATAALAAGDGAGRAAARAYAWDLGGAAVGALFASGLLLPSLGLPGTCYFCAALCLGAGAALMRRG